MRWRFGWVLVALLALAGCFDADITVDVADDGSGEAVMEVELQPLFRALLASLEESFGSDITTGEDDDALSLSSDIPDGASIERTSDYGARVSFEFATLEQLAAGMVSGDDPFFEAFSVTRDGDRFVLAARTAVIDMTSDSGGLSFDSDDIPKPKIRLAIDLPGGIVESNADERDGNRVVWRWDATAVRELSAVSDLAVSEGGGSEGAPKVVAVLLVAGLIVAIVFVRRGRGSAPSAEVEHVAGVGAAVDHELGPGAVGRLVGREEHDEVGDVVGRADPADR